MVRLLVLLLLLCLAPQPVVAAGLGVEAVDALVPRRIKVSLGVERSWMSVDARVAPADLGAPDWGAWDRDRSGGIDPAERPALLADLERLELAHLAVSVDGVVMPNARMTSAFEALPDGPIPLDQRLTLRLQTQWAQTLAVGEHRVTLYDQPRDPNGVVPFRPAFARSLKFVEGSGARAEIRGGRTRVEIATTRNAPIFWGTFVREDEAAR